MYLFIVCRSGSKSKVTKIVDNVLLFKTVKKREECEALQKDLVLKTVYF